VGVFGGGGGVWVCLLGGGGGGGGWGGGGGVGWGGWGWGGFGFWWGWGGWGGFVWLGGLVFFGACIVRMKLYYPPRLNLLDLLRWKKETYPLGDNKVRRIVSRCILQRRTGITSWIQVSHRRISEKRENALRCGTEKKRLRHLRHALESRGRARPGLPSPLGSRKTPSKSTRQARGKRNRKGPAR